VASSKLVNPEIPFIAKTDKKLVGPRLPSAAKSPHSRAAAMAADILADILILADGTGQVSDYEFEKTAPSRVISTNGFRRICSFYADARWLTNDDSSVSVSFGVSMFSE
jgi:hypothetical protein